MASLMCKGLSPLSTPSPVMATVHFVCTVSLTTVPQCVYTTFCCPWLHLDLSLYWTLVSALVACPAGAMTHLSKAAEGGSWLEGRDEAVWECEEAAGQCTSQVRSREGARD